MYYFYYYGFVVDASTLCWDGVLKLFNDFNVKEAYYTTTSGARELLDDFTYSTGIVFKVLSLIVLCVTYRYMSELAVEQPTEDIFSEIINIPRTCDDCLACIVCKDRRKNILIIPCNHVCLCLECFDELRQNQNRCPICRKVIQEMRRVYL